MAFKTDNLGRIIHDASGIVVGYKDAAGVDRFHPVVLAQSAVAASITGTTAETALASITVPGGIMGPNGSLRVTARYSVTGSANTKSFRTRLGGTAFISPGVASASSIEYKTVCNIFNRGNQSAQIGDGDSSGISAGNVSYTGAINTALDQVLTITGQLATASETITLESYTVEVLPG